MKQPQVRYKRHRSSPAQDTPAKERSDHQERMLDDALDQTFPASDPPAQTMPHDTSPGSRDAPARPSSRNRKSPRRH
jgi:hypothetical protein